jgi:3D (Asp-Asp-Asp) domain-containing protein
MHRFALIAAAGVFVVPLSLAVLVVALTGGGSALSGGAELECPPPATGGGWLATAYGPPWDGGNGSGIAATGLDLQAGPPLFEVAVDPRVIALGSYVHIEPNPFATKDVFYAGDTGAAILGRHVDIYDWQGRAAQLAWGTRMVTVSAAPAPGAANLLSAIPPPPPTSPVTPLCDGGVTSADTASIAVDGSARAPAGAPPQVKLAIAAGNAIHTLPYPTPDLHFGPLSTLWPAYDCSGATSFVLYAAGLLGPNAETSAQLGSYGAPGPGRWITIYANSAHAWIVVAGIALDTADYGGPPIPAGSGPRWRPDPTANLGDGTPYIVRHPPGL